MSTASNYIVSVKYIMSYLVAHACIISLELSRKEILSMIVIIYTIVKFSRQRTYNYFVEWPLKAFQLYTVLCATKLTHNYIALYIRRVNIN